LDLAGAVVFTIEDRNRLYDRVLELATADTRVVAGAVVGSLARTAGDRWSDLDLTFGVADGVPVGDVLEDWTGTIVAEFGATRLFDLPAETSIYRVFLVPELLQFDLSFTPAADFGAMGPDFRLLFGKAAQKPHLEPPSVSTLFGYAVHHALRARFCIERGRFWNAEYWISAARDHGLSIACVRLGLQAHYGKGFDDLPPDVLGAFDSSLVTSFDRAELLRALERVIEGLLLEAEAFPGLATAVGEQLRSLTRAK
jgi:hypothetical protein